SVAMSLSQRSLVTGVAALSDTILALCSDLGFLTCCFPKGDLGKRLFPIKLSGFNDKFFVFFFKFYVLLTGIPAATCRTLVKGFMREAEPAEIPEGYIPEHWESYKHPVSRWMAHSFQDHPENNYERAVTVLQIEAKKAELQLKELEVRRLMPDRGDRPWYEYLLLRQLLILLQKQLPKIN
uniref:NADH dehydrogenase [ubiquinone] 1 beta subcomplex subunit 5, mitochondrial n=1 Tax=Chlorocebus sabaeus TaxID=60711 RepID=A0A0D9S2A2_CHLSB